MKNKKHFHNIPFYIKTNINYKEIKIGINKNEKMRQGTLRQFNVGEMMQLNWFLHIQQSEDFSLINDGRWVNIQKNKSNKINQSSIFLSIDDQQTVRWNVFIMNDDKGVSDRIKVINFQS